MKKKSLVFLILFLLYLGPVFAWERSGLETKRIRTIETTSWGVIAGEYDTRLWLQPYNGLYITKNLGQTWSERGLEKRGVTDLAYDNERIFATTYYYENNEVGLFVSNDIGNSWAHVGNNFSASKVSAYNNIVVLGTYSHGLWLSQNGGTIWEQQLGDGVYGPEILETAASEAVLFASTNTQTHASFDKGANWNTIPALEGKRITNIEIATSVILAGTSNDGLYKSTDNGKSWEKVNSWGNTSVGAIEYFNKVFYAGKHNPQPGLYDVYQSSDFGETWEPTNINRTYNEGQILDLSSAFSKPHYMFAAVPIEGVFKYTIPEKFPANTPLFEIPWQAESSAELIERIYSYFDHEYPFLNYPPYSEPSDVTQSTLNFLGIRKDIPQMYYSGHDGYDFVLDYGVTVLSVAEGNASYKWSEEKGHAIIVVHPNGFQTEYGHLQEEGLVTMSETPLWVTSRTPLGKIGMTGITTGSHLHFAVSKTGEGSQKADPFGWQNEDMDDPWASYIWTDSLGIHTGLTSKYMWKEFPEKVAAYMDQTGGEVVLNNKRIIVDQNSSEQGFTVFVEPYEFPKVPFDQNKLTYISGASMLVNIYNILGEKPPFLLKPAKIEMDFNNANLDNILENTIRFYFWNEEEKLWEEIDSIFDVATKRLTGSTYHFSHIAAFGTKVLKRVKVVGTTFQITE